MHTCAVQMEGCDPSSRGGKGTIIVYVVSKRQVCVVLMNCVLATEAEHNKIGCVISLCL